MTMPIQKIISIRYHRNGICGAAFYTVIAVHQDGHNTRTMLHTIFPPDDDGKPTHYATIELVEPDNRWRGDHFVDDIWKAIQAEIAKPDNRIHA